MLKRIGSIFAFPTAAQGRIVVQASQPAATDVRERFHWRFRPLFMLMAALLVGGSALSPCSPAGAAAVKVSANFQKQSRDCCQNGSVKKGGVTRDKGSLSATVDLANLPVVIDGVPLSVTKGFQINDKPAFAVKGSVKAGIFFTADTTLSGSGSFTSSSCPDDPPTNCFTGSVGLSDTLGITGTARVIACAAIFGGPTNCGKVAASATANASVAGSLSDSTCGNGLSVNAALTAADASVSATLGGFTDKITIFSLSSSVPLYP